MEITVSFPGGVAVNAEFAGHLVRTDQPAPLGYGSAPSPFDLFLASLATCAGVYALRFCQERAIVTEGLKMELSAKRDAATRRLSRIVIDLQLPPAFPEKYRQAIVRAIDQCAVKKILLEPPAIDVVV